MGREHRKELSGVGVGKQHFRLKDIPHSNEPTDVTGGGQRLPFTCVQGKRHPYECLFPYKCLSPLLAPFVLLLLVPFSRTFSPYWLYRSSSNGDVRVSSLSYAPSRLSLYSSSSRWLRYFQQKHLLPLPFSCPDEKHKEPFLTQRGHSD